MKIIIDTNIILYAIRYKIDIFAELERICHFPYKICIIDKALEEVKDKAAIKLLNQKNVNIIKTSSSKNVDDLILEIADNNTIVLTQDKELKENLRKKKIALITIRQKKYLQNVL